MDVVKQHYIVDLSSNNNFLQLSAMQGDGHDVRFAEIELIENGQAYEIDTSTVDVSIMGTKPDTKEIWNICEVTEEGYILVEITQQMVAVAGRGEYTIMITHKLENRQLKSFPFFLITVKAPFDPDYIESTDEFQRLVAAINSSRKDAAAAKEAAERAAASEANAKDSETNAKASEDAAQESEEAAQGFANESEDWKKLSQSYAVGTNGEVRFGDEEDNSKFYSEKSKEYSEDSEGFAQDSSNYADESKDYSNLSKSYAVGTNGAVRQNDATDNSEYYSKQSKNSATTAQTILNNVIIEGENAVNAIQEALDVVAPNFVMDLATGHLKWEGGRFKFEVGRPDVTYEKRGHLLWGLIQ